MNRWTQTALLAATLMLATTQGIAQPLPPDFNPGKTRRDTERPNAYGKPGKAAAPKTAFTPLIGGH